jgi:hypothetical protein
LEDYTPSEEIGLLDEGIDRYFGIGPHKAFAILDRIGLKAKLCRSTLDFDFSTLPLGSPTRMRISQGEIALRGPR